MREIKFRAWDGERMVTTLFSLSLSGQLYFDAGSGGEQCCEYPLMQYTGLKDKNGVEIYEGDIVTWGFGNSAVRMGTLYEGDGEVRTGWVCFDCFINNEGQVIGNIYENPELLEKDK